MIAIQDKQAITKTIGKSDKGEELYGEKLGGVLNKSPLER